MTKGNPSELQPFDPEIDRTFHRLVRHSVHPTFPTFPEHFIPVGPCGLRYLKKGGLN